MRNIFRSILYKPVRWAVRRFSARPQREKVFAALDALYTAIEEQPGKRGLLLPFEPEKDRFIIFSDQHKGRRNGADDFTGSESNYIKALEHYNNQGYTYINLGDSEELWENSIWQVKKHNKAAFAAERNFLVGNRFIKIFGNHDLFWDNDPLAAWHLKDIYGEKLRVYEGLILQPVTREGSRLFLTHGHQGDAQSDGNWFSKFFIANIWAPLQAWLRINPNTPAWDTEKKTVHNHLMYEWSAGKEELLLITGHTHQPVFSSLTHLERLYKNFQEAMAEKSSTKEEALRKEIRIREQDFTAVAVDYMHMKPSYFNTGCCCFHDGDITGIELAGEEIRLIKWSAEKGRELLEWKKLI
ncbi:MAG: metallophosphoesterase [Chitinophagales bacterium]|nr:metallophosphoesterase [Chitinophagales bacterium]